MGQIRKSESICAGLRKGFQDGTSKMAQRRCYGYGTDADGELVVNPDGARWNRESINKLIFNERYTERVLLQKTVRAGGSKIKNDGLTKRYLYSDSHEAIISKKVLQSMRDCGTIFIDN